jgi:subtilisin family serine protease
MKRLLSLLFVLTLVFALVPAPAAAEGEAQSYLLIANGNKLPKGLAKQVEKAGGVVTQEFGEIGIAVVESSQGNFKGQAAKFKGVRAVVPNLTVQWVDPVDKVALEDYSNPPTSGDDDFFFDLQWGHDAVDAPEAWEAGLRGAGATVAVLDGGFDLDHPDLAPNINYALSADMTGEGLQYGLPDTFSHGTHTAGTVAAADNAFGTIGVAPEAELVLVKVLGDEGSGSFNDVIAGILHAASVDVDVINMSLGARLIKSGDPDDPDGPYTAKEAADLKNAIGRATTYAYQQGVTVIASAGNDGEDYDHNANVIHLPSDAPHVLSISATAPVGWAVDPENAFLDYPASYTNYGQSAIDFAAPGGDFVYPGNEACLVAGLLRPCWVFDLVFSTGNGGWYWSAGTSMSAPHAAGVAALIIGDNGGDMKPAQVDAALRQLADDLGKPGNDDYYGLGAIDAFNGND